MEAMSISTFLTAVLIGAFLIWLVRKLYKELLIPPGPWGLPFIGQLVHLNKTNALLEYQKWRETYGDIFSYKLGQFNFIVVNDYKDIHDLLKREELLGRPDLQSWTVRNRGFKDRGILFSDGVESWSEQRRFALRTLRDFGFGKQGMEGLLLHELKELLDSLRNEARKGGPMDVMQSFNASVFNSLWAILTGERFQLDDPKFQKILQQMQGHLRMVTITSAGSFYPWPAKHNLVRRGLWQKMVDMYDSIFILMSSLVQEHLDSYEENQTRDFIDSYLHRVEGEKKVVGSTSSFNKENWRNNLEVVLVDMFSAGAETTSTTMVWAVLYMAKCPEAQAKLQKEVDQVIGKGRLPSKEDKPNMPYLEAFMNETHRKCSLLPVNVYHKMMQDMEYKGYLFPKGSVVYMNLDAAHNDKKVWKDPENFRPERFLDEEGNLLKFDALMPFSTGKRVCLGETLARDTLFLFLAGLVQNFHFELDKESQGCDINAKKPIFVAFPDPFQVIIRSR